MENKESRHLLYHEGVWAVAGGEFGATWIQGHMRVMWREVRGSRKNVPVACEFGLG